MNMVFMHTSESREFSSLKVFVALAAERRM